MKHVSSQLITKRAELQGELNQLNKEVRIIKDLLKNIDASIKVFEPNFDTSKIKPKRFYKKNQTFKKGEISKLIFQVLREAGRALSAKEIVEKVMLKKNFDLSNANIYNGIETNIRKNLDKHRLITSIKETGHPKKWKIGPLITQQTVSQ